jgi:ankyrin repeat protein
MTSFPIMIDVIIDITKPTVVLHWEARRGDVVTTKIFLKLDRERSLPRDERVNTLLHEAAAFGQTEVLDFLLSMKLDLEATNDHELTALHMAQWLAIIR